MTRNFKVSRTFRGDVVFLRLEGYLNNQGGEEVERQFKTEVENGHKKFVLDFCKIAYINSIGISFLVGILETTRKEDLRVCFTSLSGINEELFEMVGLKKDTIVLRSNEEAFEFLSGP
ncbi:MAG: STAS domain-containing protein [Thermodesulfobacteriota bacterium]